MASAEEGPGGDGSYDGYDGSYADRQVFDQSYTHAGRQRSGSEASRVQSEAVRARSRTNPLAGLGGPEVEYSAYEAPSAEVCDDYRNVLEDHGIEFSSVREIALAYDQLRQTRRHSATMIDHNNDLLQAQQWQKRFKGMIERIKAQRHQESKGFQSLDAKRVLLARV